MRTGILVFVKPIPAIALLLFWPFMATAQTPSSYSIKSWKAGTAQAEAQTLNISLSREKRTYHQIINDISGHALYRLLVRPAVFVGPGDGIVAWHVFLTTLDADDNLLLPANSLEQEEYEGPDYLWWFYPGQNRLVPIEAKRVIQVEGSYVALKAGDIKVNDEGQLESMQLTITFSATPPSSPNR